VVHILTVCDTVVGGGGQPSTGRCQWEVTHADGSLVSNASRASVGEELVAYAVGLGATNPPTSLRTRTGQHKSHRERGRTDIFRWRCNLRLASGVTSENL
jgi:hypothetical protein